MSLCVGLSTLGFVNAIIFQASRTVFAAVSVFYDEFWYELIIKIIFLKANNNHMPSIFGLITLKYHTPMISVVFAGFMSLVYLFIKDIYTLLNMSMVVFFINHIATISALLLLRKTQPDTPRPIKVNIPTHKIIKSKINNQSFYFKVNLFFPIVFLIICFYITFMILLMYPRDFLLCILTYIIGIVAYFIFVKLQKPQSLQKKISKQMSDCFKAKYNLKYFFFHSNCRCGC